MSTSRRNRDTRAATSANILRKRRKWAEELRAAGWRVEEPPPPPLESTPSIRFLQLPPEMPPYSS